MHLERDLKFSLQKKGTWYEKKKKNIRKTLINKLAYYGLSDGIPGEMGIENAFKLNNFESLIWH
jgi:hypothetical protein